MPTTSTTFAFDWAPFLGGETAVSACIICTLHRFWPKGLLADLQLVYYPRILPRETQLPKQNTISAPVSSADMCANSCNFVFGLRYFGQKFSRKLHSEIAFKIKVMRKSWKLVCDVRRGRQVGESFSQSWRHFLTPNVSHTTRGAPGWLRRYELRAVYLCVLAGDTCNQIDTKTGTHQPLPPRHLAPRWASPKGFEDGDGNFGRTFAYPHVASRVNSAWLHVCVCVSMQSKQFQSQGFHYPYHMTSGIFSHHTKAQ